jgi:hypothetical protein
MKCISLSTYMRLVKSAITARKEELLETIGYEPLDKDTGYRSWLRFTDTDRTAGTDAEAQIMIYGEPRSTVIRPTCVQELFTFN